MVRIIFLVILLLPVIAFAKSEPITGNSLKNWLSNTESEHNRHSKEVKSNKLHELLIKNKAAEKTVVKKTEAEKKATPLPEEKNDKYNFFVKEKTDKIEPAIKAAPNKNALPYIEPGGTRTKSAQSKKKTKIEPAHQKKAVVAKKTIVDPDRYTPPSWRNSKTKKASPIHSGRSNSSKKGPVFGIRLGTEFRAKLIRTTTNVEPTLAEFIVVDDVYGDFKMLHGNSQLFARKKLSTSSNRLYLNCIKGITPEGVEFEIFATVTDISTNKLAGLTGAITTDNKMMKRSVATGAFAAGSEILKTAPGVSVLGQAATTAASSALSEKQSETDANLGDAQFVIYVNPQEVFIRVDKTF